MHEASERAPIKPQPVDTPLGGVPSTVEVGSWDLDIAVALWDVSMDDQYAGLLNARVGEAAS